MSSIANGTLSHVHTQPIIVILISLLLKRDYLRILDFRIVLGIFSFFWRFVPDSNLAFASDNLIEPLVLEFLDFRDRLWIPFFLAFLRGRF